MSWSQNGNVYTFTCTHTLNLKEPDNVTELDVDVDDAYDWHCKMRHLITEVPYGITVRSTLQARYGTGGGESMKVEITSDPKLPKAVGELKRRSVAEYLHGRDLPEPPYRVEL